MKRLFLLIFLFIAFFYPTMQLSAQWLNIFSNDSLRDLDALNKDTVFAVGLNKILRTYDGGTTWQNMSQSFQFDAVEVVFPNDTVGYMSGYEKIMKTNDCGLTWKIVKTDNSGNWYRTLCFPNYEFGLAQSWNYYGDTIFRTTDGGQNWAPVFSRPLLFDIQMLDETTGYLASDSLFKTIDGGITWQCVSNISNYIADEMSALGFSSPDTGLVVIWPSVLGKTNNGGDSWEFIEPDLPFNYKNNYLCVLNSSHYYFSGWDPLLPCGGVYYSGDGGYNWTEQLMGSGQHYLFNEIDMVSDSIGYVINLEYGVYKTINGGFLVGIDDPITVRDKRFIVQPNPVKDNLVICSKDSFKKSGISIYDIHGRLVIKQPLTPNAETLIPFLNFPAGMYFYLIQQDSKMIESGKFIKTKTF